MELAKLKVSALRKRCKRLGLEVEDKMTKDSYIKLIEEELAKQDMEKSEEPVTLTVKPEKVEKIVTPSIAETEEFKEFDVDNDSTFIMNDITFICTKCGWKSLSQSIHDTHYNDAHAEKIIYNEPIVVIDDTLTAKLNKISVGREKFNDGFIKDSFRTLSTATLILLEEHKEMNRKLDIIEELIRQL